MDRILADLVNCVNLTENVFEQLQELITKLLRGFGLIHDKTKYFV
jgi:hypothetical protein